MDKNADLDRILKVTLIRLGIRCDSLGFSLMIKCIKHVIDDTDLVYKTGELFKRVAKETEKNTPTRVEANIQNALNAAYFTHGFAEMNKLYGCKIFVDAYKPTVGEFIRLVAEYYLTGLYKKDFIEENVGC